MTDSFHSPSNRYYKEITINNFASPPRANAPPISSSSNKIWRIIKLVIMQFSPNSHVFPSYIRTFSSAPCSRISSAHNVHYQNCVVAVADRAQQVLDEDYEELLERLRAADLLYTEYSLEEVIYQLAKVMFSQSLTRGEHKTQNTVSQLCWEWVFTYRHKEGQEMVVHNFLLLVLSSFFQIHSFSRVCSSSVFSFTFKLFQTLFLLLSFYCSRFPTLFRSYAFLTAPCFVFQGISIILLYVSSLAFLSSSLFLFYFLPSNLLTIISCTLFVPFSVPFPPSFSCLLPPSCCVMSAGSCLHAAPPTSNQALTSRLPLYHVPWVKWDWCSCVHED